MAPNQFLDLLDFQISRSWPSQDIENTRFLILPDWAAVGMADSSALAAMASCVRSSATMPPRRREAVSFFSIHTGCRTALLADLRAVGGAGGRFPLCRVLLIPEAGPQLLGHGIGELPLKEGVSSASFLRRRALHGEASSRLSRRHPGGIQEAGAPAVAEVSHRRGLRPAPQSV